ncbi:hypothetical protein P9112_004528 [Eukaryota sp. TZLM1-RC]
MSDTEPYTGPSYDHFKLTTIPLPYLENVAVDSRYEETDVLPDASLLDPDLIGFNPESTLVQNLSRKRRRNVISEDNLLPEEKIPRSTDDNASSKMPILDSSGNLVTTPSLQPDLSTNMQETSASIKEIPEPINEEDPQYLSIKKRQSKQLITNFLNNALASEEFPLTLVTQLVTLSDDSPSATWIRQKSKEMTFRITSSCSLTPSVRMQAIAAASTVFCDMLPDYRIRSLTEKEKSVDNISKDVMKERMRNDELLAIYKKFICNLEKLVINAKKASDGGLIVAATSALGNLLTSRPQFNFVDLIISILIKGSSIFIRKQFGEQLETQIRTISANALQTVIEDDSLSQLSLSIASRTNKLIKKSISSVSTEHLSIFEHLKVSSGEVPSAVCNQQSDEQALVSAKMRRKREKEFKKLPKHLRQAKKEQKEVEKEINDKEMVKTRNKKNTIKTQILNSIFAIYLRIIKTNEQQSLVLRPVALRGIANFAEFLSVDLLLSMLTSLKEMISNSETSLESALHAATVVIVSLKGPAEAINFEFTDFHSVLYKRLLDLMFPENYQFTELYIRVLSEVLSQKKKVSTSRAGAFFKRLVSLSLHLPAQQALYLAVQAKKLLLQYPSLSCIMSTDPEDRAASAVFDPLVSNPDQANGLNAYLNEIVLFPSHFHPTVMNVGEFLTTSAVPKNFLISSEKVFDPEPKYSKLKSAKRDSLVELPDIFNGEITQELVASLETLNKFVDL